MTGYQRYCAMLKGDPVDHLPRVPILMQYAAEYIGCDYAAFASDHNVLVDANLAIAQDFGMDQVSTISDPYRETQGFGSEIEYLTDAPPRSSHPLADNPDLSLLPNPDPLSSVRMWDRVEAVRKYKQICDDQYSILGWVEGPAAEAADLRDVSTFMMDLMDDEVYAGKLMDRCVQVAIEFAKAQVDSGADTIGVGDAVASQVSADIYERLILPREKQLISAIQSMGAFVRIHICGNITHLLPGIATLHVDILDVDHLADIKQVRQIVGQKVRLAGNIDPVNGVLHGSPESIQQYIKQTYDAVGNPYFVNAGCEIPSGTPVENLKALCKPVTYHAS